MQGFRLRWYGTIIASSCWIHLDKRIHEDPIAECNGDTIPPLHYNFPSLQECEIETLENWDPVKF